MRRTARHLAVVGALLISVVVLAWLVRSFEREETREDIARHVGTSGSKSPVPGQPTLRGREARLPQPVEQILLVRVETLQGTPVPGAEVTFHPIADDGRMARRVASETETHADGACELRCTSARGFVGVRAAGFRPSVVTYVASTSRLPLTFRLNASQTEAFRVVRAGSGEPVPGAEVGVVSLQGTSEFAGSTPGRVLFAKMWSRVVSDDEGLALLPLGEFPPWAYVVGVQRTEGLIGYDHAAALEKAGVLGLRPGVGFRVEVVDDAGDPVLSATARVVLNAAEMLAFPCDDAGVARCLAPVTGEVLDLVVEAPGYALATFRMNPPGRQVDVVLHPAATLEVRVVDQAGAGVPRARVSAVPFGLTPRDPVGSAVCDAEGRALLRLARETFSNAEATYFVLARGDGFATGATRVVMRGDREAVTVRLSAARSFSIRVQDARGEPVRGAEVLLECLRDRGEDASALSALNIYRLVQRTDTEGIVRFSGESSVHAHRATAFTDDGRLATAVIPAGKPGAAGDAVLALASAGSLRIVVTDEEGDPVRGARVRLTAIEALPSRLVWEHVADALTRYTDAEGTVHLQGRPDGKVTLLVSKVGTVPQMADIPPEQDRLSLSVRRWASIQGRVVGMAPGMAPTVVARRQAYDARRDLPEVTTQSANRASKCRADGTFLIDGLLPGAEYWISLEGFSGRGDPRGHTRVVAPAENVLVQGVQADWIPIRIVLRGFPRERRGAMLSVEVGFMSLDGEPSSVIKVGGLGADGAMDVTLPRGRVALRCTVSGCFPMSTVVDVTDWERTITLDPEWEGRLAFRVVDEQGNPVEGAAVSVTSPPEDVNAGKMIRERRAGDVMGDRTNAAGEAGLPCPPGDAPWEARASKGRRRGPGVRGKGPTDGRRVLVLPEVGAD